MATSSPYPQRFRRGWSSSIRFSALTFACLAASTSLSAQSSETVKCLPAILIDDAATQTRTSMTDQGDTPVQSGRFAGHVVAMTFIPRNCETVCAMRLVDLDKVARTLPAPLARRLKIVAIDTGHRSAADLRTLMKTWHLDRTRWTMLRGETEAARRRVDVAPADATEPSNVVAVFDASGLLRQRYAGDPLDRERLAREIAVIDSLSRHPSADTCSALSSMKPTVRGPSQ